MDYHELIVDDGLVNKVYELTVPMRQRGVLLGIPDGCIDLQVMDGAGGGGFVAGSYRCGRPSGASGYERCFGIKFVSGLEYSFSNIEGSAVFDTRIDAGSFVEVDVLEDIAHLPLSFEERARLAVKHFGIENRGAYFEKSDVLVSYVTKAILDSRGLIRIDDLVERTGYSHRYVSQAFKDVMGCTMKTYANIIRIQNAIKLLSDERCDSMTGLDIGSGLGFYDQAHFDKQFKRYTTLTPSQVRSDASSMLFL